MPPGSTDRPPAPATPSPTPPPAISVDLVEAKLAPPQLRPDVLPRDALIGRLLQAGGEPIVTLVAPAGYGKSTTLALWRSCEPRPVAWLTADEADADPSRFLAHLAAAIGRATGLDLSALDELLASGVSVLSIVVPRLSSALFRAGRPLVVMLDDVHRLSGTATIDALTMLIDYLPPGVIVALAGRGDAGLPLARLRAAGRLLELTAADLSFHEQESARLAALRGHDLGPQGARALQAATEGWPAAVYLAVRRPRGAARDDGSFTPSGRDADIAEYLDEELLDTSTPRIREFMLRTSVLERMTGEVCDEVTGGSGSHRILGLLAERNLLVVPLDTQGGWYRYHPLLREHLVGRLEREPTEAADCHRRAAAWYARHGQADEAVDHLFAAGDVDAAAAQATGVAVQLYRGGREATVARWIDRLSEADIRRHPHLAVIAALAAALGGRAGEAERMADLAEDSTYPVTRPAGAEAFEAARATVRALIARHGLATAVADAGAGVAAVTPGSPWHPTASVVLGGVLIAAGDLDRGDAVLSDAATSARAHGAARSAALASAWQAMLAIERDDWRTVDRLSREGLESAARYPGDPDATAAVVSVVAARSAVHRGEVGEAHRLTAAFQVARASLGVATPWLSVRCLLEAARAHLALADPAGARSCLVQAADIIARRPGLGDLPDQVIALRERIRHLPPGPGGASTLTPAEVRVLRLLPTYLTASEMAERLSVTTNTVRTQIQSLYGKLDATSRAEAVERAIEAGLLEPLPVLARGRITSG